MKSYIIDKEKLEQIRKLQLPEKKENNQYLLLHVHGDDRRAPTSFNIKVYSSKKGLKLVTNDDITLQKLLEGKETKKDYERIIDIDDSGWGCPLGGVLVGMHDSATNQLLYDEVPSLYFQGYHFERGDDQIEYAERGVLLISKLHGILPIDKEKTLIKICTGHINIELKDKLRKAGFSVEIAVIGEPLQSWLEQQHKEYLKKKYNYHGYIDPKESTPDKISNNFEQLMQFIKDNKLFYESKNGWKSFDKYFPKVPAE